MDSTGYGVKFNGNGAKYWVLLLKKRFFFFCKLVENEHAVIRFRKKKKMAVEKTIFAFKTRSSSTWRPTENYVNIDRRRIGQARLTRATIMDRNDLLPRVRHGSYRMLFIFQRRCEHFDDNNNIIKKHFILPTVYNLFIPTQRQRSSRDRRQNTISPVSKRLAPLTGRPIPTLVMLFLRVRRQETNFILLFFSLSSDSFFQPIGRVFEYFNNNIQRTLYTAYLFGTFYFSCCVQ